MALPPGTRFGSYEVVGPIGAGGMGEVYHARDTRLDRDVAIKVLPDGFAADAERVARFDREARTLASLSHPNIAAVYGFEPVGDSNALVLEYIEGPTLADRIAQGPVPLDEAIAIILQVADALGAAHDQGIVHRDLKPANIKVRPDGSVKVLDFGLAKAFLPDATGKSGSVSMSPTITTPAMTAHGVIMGTAAYMAPEQAKGRPVGKRADLWALGCVLFEMLSGQRPFDGEDMTEVLASVIKSEPDWTRLPAGLPPAVLRLVRDCLEKDPRRRIADASVVRYVLEHPVTGAASASVAAPVKARAGWRTWAAAAAALAAVTAAAVFGTMAFTTPVLKPYRLAVVPSAGQPFDPTGSERDLAVTPDGRQIIYRTDVGETSKLVVRDVNADGGRVLEGTEGARGPFVSPDGLWVGYFSAGNLKKVLVTGGPSVTLCAAAGASRGGSWAGDTIVFATSDVTTGLMRVPAAGGVPTVISRPDPAAGETDHGFPWLMPDGSHALFSMLGPDGTALGSINLETQERKVLLRDGSRHAQYLTNGILLFEQGGALRAARFDASRMELTSDPVPVVERVGSAVASPSYAVSGDGLLIYVPGRTSTGAGRTMVWVSPDGREEPLKIDARDFVDPRLSSDDRQAVVEINDALDDVWTLDLTRGTVTRQSFEPGEDETSAWMDGRTLVYASTRAAVGRAIFRRRADGVGGEDPIWTGPGHAHVEAITPNGTAMIFSQAAVNGGQMDLMLLPLDGSGKVGPLLQTPFNEFGARLSPDGSAIAYVSNESGRPEVYLRSFPSLEGKVQVSTNGATQPVWSRRGDELYFVSSDAMMAARVQSGATFTVGQPRKLFDNQYYSKGLAHTGYDVARDGRFLMVKEAPQGQDGLSNNLLVVLNWFEELKEKLK